MEMTIAKIIIPFLLIGLIFLSAYWITILEEGGLRLLFCWYFHRKYHKDSWGVFWTGHGICEKCGKLWDNYEGLD